ncbi:MAG: mechanosensitive ion channel [Pseudomonadota bacterium]|nr:mechanosensitive ion channel [Pseudomonadota bacterium]
MHLPLPPRAALPRLVALPGARGVALLLAWLAAGHLALAQEPALPTPEPAPVAGAASSVEAAPEDVEAVEAAPDEVEEIEAAPDDVEAVEAAPDDVEEIEAAPPAKRPAARRRRTAGERWVRAKVPDELEGKVLFGLEWWQWLAFPMLGLVSAGSGRLLGGFTRIVLDRLVRATTPRWDDELLEHSRGPLYLAWAFGVALVLLTFLYLRAPAHLFLTEGLRVGLLVSLVWVALRAMDIGGVAASQSALAQGRAGAVSVVPLVVRASKIALVAVGVVVVLSSLGYPVTSLLAGLGIGGLALALAAQKTAENVFGSVSLGIDQPLRVGDLVRIEDFTGVVEAIGLRSTRIRTQDRTIVTLPNGRLADMRIENYTVRDRMRLSCVLGLEYGTTPDQVRGVLAALEATLMAHPKIWPEVVAVRFSGLGAHSLDISVSAWFLVSDPDAMLVIRQEMLLAFLDVLTGAGVRLAFPTQTLHLVRDPG